MMELIIDVDEKIVCKGFEQPLTEEERMTLIRAIGNGRSYNPSGDLISRLELKKWAIPCQIHNGALTELCVPLYQIDNAPTVQAFTLEDMQNNSIDRLTNELRKWREERK